MNLCAHSSVNSLKIGKRNKTETKVKEGGVKLKNVKGVFVMDKTGDKIASCTIFAAKMTSTQNFK